jgi:hypothetical protein
MVHAENARAAALEIPGYLGNGRHIEQVSQNNRPDYLLASLALMVEYQAVMTRRSILKSPACQGAT